MLRVQAPPEGNRHSGGTVRHDHDRRPASLQLFEAAGEPAFGGYGVGVIRDRDQAPADRALDEGTQPATQRQNHVALALGAELPATSYCTHQGMDIGHVVNDMRWFRGAEWAWRQKPGLESQAARWIQDESFRPWAALPFLARPAPARLRAWGSKPRCRLPQRRRRPCRSRL